MADREGFRKALAGGTIIREPERKRPHYWAGAPGLFFDPKEKAYYLTYRRRRPREIQPDRGYEVFVARSTDGIRFEDVWSVAKAAYNSTSIERSAIRRGPDGQWRYFTSYVDTDGRWMLSMLKASSVKELDARKVKPLFRAADVETEGIKDPWILEEGGEYSMFVSVPLATSKTTKGSHGTSDIYNTGECVSATALLTSKDLDLWKWEGVVFKPEGKGWDCYCRRINSVVKVGKRYLAFYDGAAGHGENYEEKTGLAVSSDLRSWTSITPDAPALGSPHASRSLRYIDAQVIEGKARIYYEFARPDASHDMRVHVTSPADLEKLL